MYHKHRNCVHPIEGRYIGDRAMKKLYLQWFEEYLKADADEGDLECDEFKDGITLS